MRLNTWVRSLSFSKGPTKQACRHAPADFSYNGVVGRVQPFNLS
jgi:hypothetical protein